MPPLTGFAVKVTDSPIQITVPRFEETETLTGDGLFTIKAMLFDVTGPVLQGKDEVSEQVTISEFDRVLLEKVLPDPALTPLTIQLYTGLVP